MSKSIENGAKKTKTIKVLMLGILLPLILVGQIASSAVGIQNIVNYGNAVIQGDLNNGYTSALQMLDNYFWGIEYRMMTMEKTGIIQDELIAKDFKATEGILEGLKGATDVITSTVFRSVSGGVNLSVPNVNYASKGMSGIIEDEYFQKAIDNDIVWIGPYEDKLSGLKTLSIYKAICDTNGKAVGVLGMNINYNDVSVYLSERVFSETGYNILLGKDGTIYSDARNMEAVHTVTTNSDIAKIAAESGESEGSILIDGSDCYYKATDVPRTEWRMISVISKNEHDDVTGKTRTSQIMVMFVMVVISAVLVLVLINGITRRLFKIKVAMNKAGEGDLTSKAPLKAKAAQRLDELDDIADSYNRMLEQFGTAIKDTKMTLDNLSQKNNSLNEACEELNISSSQISETINQVAAVSNEQAVETSSAVGKADDLSEIIESVSGSLVTMKTSCTELEDKTNFGLETVENLVASSNEAIRATEEINRSIQNVDSSSKEIENITGLINNISEQTNLLALNASIEAARAGEAGRGFAVVANEIRNLAEQTKTATSNISDIILSMQGKIKDTVDSVEDVSNVMVTQGTHVKNTEDSFEKMAKQVESLNKILATISGLNEDMIQKKDNILSSMTNLSAGIEETSASTEEITTHTEKQSNIAKGLDELAGEIVVDSDNLVQKIEHFKLQ